MKKTLGLLAVVMCVSAFAETVYWTGRVETVFTVSGKQANKCYYSFGVNDHRPFLFVKKDGEMFPPPCPAKIEVE